MNTKTESITFHLIGLKGKSPFKDFGHEVPSLASVFLRRLSDIPVDTGVEAGVFEPCNGDVEADGVFYVGVLTEEKLSVIPEDLTTIEVSGSYAVATGKMSAISEVHQQLNEWINSEGHIRSEDDLIVETYHPDPDGERVTIYLPLHDQKPKQSQNV